jgi:hypothetical protein
LIISKKNKIILITPPKTGTHSITNYLSGVISDKSLPINQVGYPIYHLTISEICYVFNINQLELKEYKIIQCVRNPYTRITSAYFHQMKLQNNHIEFERFLEKIQETKHLLPHNLDEFYIKFYGNITYKHNSFKNNNWGGARFYYEQIWFNDLNLNNITYFKLEDLSADSVSLSNFLGVNNKKFPHINKNQTPTDYNNLYNEKNISIVGELYNNDLKYFNYEF